MLITLFMNILPISAQKNYRVPYLKPHSFSDAELTQHMIEFYWQWKEHYLKKSRNGRQYYVFVDKGKKTVSEAIGYGMLISVFMAPYDSLTRKYFDGLYAWYRAHPSKHNPVLMEWKQEFFPLSLRRFPSASDGDMDVAFALLLAANVWPAKASYYLHEARKLLKEIFRDNVNHHLHIIKLGDWCKAGQALYFNAMRTSDIMPDHFRVFGHFTGNAGWYDIMGNSYQILQQIQWDFAPQTGLFPDFILEKQGKFRPAYPYWLEGKYDGLFYFNACRVPWRIGVDYLLSGDPRDKKILKPFIRWLSNLDEKYYSNGYTLDGKPLTSSIDAVFLSGFCIAAMISPENPDLIDKLYRKLIEQKINHNDYYGNTLKMLTLIVISGIYRMPALP